MTKKEIIKELKRLLADWKAAREGPPGPCFSVEEIFFSQGKEIAYSNCVDELNDLIKTFEKKD